MRARLPWLVSFLLLTIGGLVTLSLTRGQDRDGTVPHVSAPAVEALAFDPQTSGGLLAAVSPHLAGDLWEPIGRVVAGPPGVHLRWGD